jgi:hypothetical protein
MVSDYRTKIADRVPRRQLNYVSTPKWLHKRAGDRP